MRLDGGGGDAVGAIVVVVADVIGFVAEAAAVFVAVGADVAVACEPVVHGSDGADVGAVAAAGGAGDGVANAAVMHASDQEACTGEEADGHRKNAMTVSTHLTTSYDRPRHLSH